MMDVLRDGAVIAGYRIESLIGRGGMAVVYRAEDSRLGRKVALKVLTPELMEHEQFRARFIQESRIAASLDHPNIIPIFEAGEAEDALFIAMRYVEGNDLKTVLAEQGPLETARLLRLFTQIGDALDAAHQSGLVHRDVKPGNVLLARGHEGSDHVYLTDFGLTKRTSSLSEGLTRAGHFLGTIDYVAPEQIASKPVDSRTDIYALGCVLYECLTGQLPFHRDDDAALLWAHLVEAPPPATALRPDLPSDVDGVIARAMAKTPDDRYGSCQDLVGDLHDALGSPQGLPRPRPFGGLAQPGAATGSAPAVDRLVATAGTDYPPPLTGHPSFPPGSVPPLAPSPPAEPAPWEGAASYSDSPPYEEGPSYEASYEDASPPYEDAPPPYDGSPPYDEETPEPRRRPRWLLPVVVVAVVVALVAGAGVYLTSRGPSLSAHFTKNQVVGFSFDYPSDWRQQQSGVNTVFARRADALGPLFISNHWAETGSLLKSSPGDAVGLYTSFGFTQLDSLDPQALVQELQSLLPDQVTFDPGQQSVALGGLSAKRLEGRLVDPASGSQLRLVTYVAQVQDPQDKDVVLAFISAPADIGKNRKLFDRIAATVDFFH